MNRQPSADAMAGAVEIQLGLYVHFPWCVAKCPYCDFNSHSLRGKLPAEDYLDALLIDLRLAAPALEGRIIQTVFFGGGTPSLFAPEHFARLLDAAERELGLAADAEVTMEANPGAVEHAAFAGYRDAGINRLSLGVQSFDDQKLAALGRIHSAEDARSAATEARAAGFDNINLDLMFALPDQSLEDALADVDAAIELVPEHISHYHLTLEPNTVLYARPPELPDDDLAWEMQIRCAEKLTGAGYTNYEVSAWAQPGSACEHNLNYWRYGDYLGLGAGAHGKLTSAAGEQWREIRPAHPRAFLDYAAAAKPLSRLPISAADARFEFMLNNLRLREGFLPARFTTHTGQPAAALEKRLEEARGLGFIEDLPDGRMRPTERGWRFLDDLQGIFLPEDQN
jgi:oxygen-independent coproporphyrinogen-3 oxidase